MREAWEVGRGGPNSAHLPCNVSMGEPDVKKPWHKVACADPHPVPRNLEVMEPEMEIPADPSV